MMQKAGRRKVVLDLIQSGNQFVAELYVSDSTKPPFFASNLHYLSYLLCSYFASHLLALLSCDGTQILTAQTSDFVKVAASVDLCADENYRSLKK
jgi:hypothetical protein